MQCAPMGFRAVDWRRFADARRSVRMFLTTAGSSPFCRNQYHIQATVASTDETRKQHSNRGTLFVHLQGSKPPDTWLTRSRGATTTTRPARRSTSW
ncbi:hypothetical protein IscW_ISCW009028 [Ixodes scapularis]|uniref:Uncharacterized protein n=1 Tax=Ixodes scapularis TaxID=6945 RepID=B7Q377_IXOSC|nr:hypothetical protein IscW_ISCW009028 [Ixodes scapularis]|eukprot:XP_002411175.1 hypothetical protein IscW_ISCW009028 [Ixodes scapularis]